MPEETTYPTNEATTPSVVDLPSALVDEYKKLFDFSVAEITLRRLVNDWTSEIEMTDVRRKIRDVNLMLKLYANLVN